MDDSFVKAPVAVPRLSGFDKSHQNLLTSKVGTITPILCDELIPGTKVNLKLALNASLPPLATDTYMRCSIKTEAFFVPMRLLDGGFEAWFVDDKKDLVEEVSASGVPTTVSSRAYLPVIKDATANPSENAPWVSKLGSGTLADYLGIRSADNRYFKRHPVTALPFLAYHKIYNDWYRNTLIQKECFLPSSPATEILTGASASPFVFHDANNYLWTSLKDFALADGHCLLDLRQRNFGLDYFTTATPSPQQGEAMTVSFDTSGSSGQFSIATLRASNSMQQFKERNNLLGNLYVENLAGRYGVRPSDGIAQRSLYLGRGDFEVYSKGIYQTFGNQSEGSAFIGSVGDSSNPFGAVGTRYGSAYASGQNFLVNFEAKEPGYLFVMASLVPRVTYSSGVDRMFHHYVGEGSLSDMANPILQNVGPQPIYNIELTGDDSLYSTEADRIFGFTDRYAEFKTKNDTLHGLVRDGETLEAFALQRTLTSSAVPLKINSAFLQIPTDYMDNVTAVKQWISEYGYWLDTYFDYKVAMPLSKYSLPSLQDPAYEHGKTIVVSKGGSKL